MKKASFFLLLLSAAVAHAQQANAPFAIRYFETSAYSKNFTDAFSGLVNQAALPEIKQAVAGVYADRRYMLKELSSYNAALALPSRLGGFGVAIHYVGAENFNTSQIGIGYGKKLNEKISIGIQFNYYNIRLAGYGSSSTINFEAGTLLHLTDKLHIGVHVCNPFSSKFGKTRSERLPSIYSTGIGYEVSGKLLISAVVRKQENTPVDIGTTLQYIIADHLFVRVGTGTSNPYYFFGLGIQWKTFRLDAVSTWQAPLGFTPGLMLLFNFHEDKSNPESEK